MADCYIVRRGGTGNGSSEKGIIDLTDKECLLNMVNTYLFSEVSGYTSNGYIVLPSAKVFGSYKDYQMGISVKYNYPSDFNVLTDVITTYTDYLRITHYNLKNFDGINEGAYSYVNNLFNSDSVYISEDVACKYPAIKKHFGKWHDYRDLRYLDIVKFPPKMNEDVFTDFVIFTQNFDGKTPKIWGLKNLKELYIDRSNKALYFRAEYCYGWRYNPSSYDPTLNKDRENRDNNSHWDNFTVDGNEIVNYIAYTTRDILYEDGTIAVKANCTIDDVIQKE